MSAVKAVVRDYDSMLDATGRPPAAGKPPGSAARSSSQPSGGKAGGGGTRRSASRPRGSGRSPSSPGERGEGRVGSPTLARAGSILAGSRPTSGSSQRGGEASAVPTESRDAIQDRLAKAGFISHDNPLFMHGRAYAGPVKQAQVLWRSDKPPRKDHDAPEWLTATEFQDAGEVVHAKCEQLANLLRLSKKTVLYTGAGISASVIGQAALSGQNKVGWKPNKLCAKPTPTHCALGLLGQQGIIHSWVQQNHDGLPQKAGFPQEGINEIHGSWYDPCNPVVKYSGTLHERSFPWMENDAETADLVLVLGTSLGGLNADQVATNAAERSLYTGPRGSLGTVCINLQQTAVDGMMTLRLFGKSDDLLKVLLQKLGLKMPKQGDLRLSKESRALVPYDADGRRLPEGSREKWMWLDLSERQKIRITEGHNIQGAKQPQYMHIGTAGKPGLGTVVGRDEDSCSFSLSIEGASMRLGIWWLDAAARGGVEVLPVVNQNPIFGSPASEAGAAPAAAAAKARARPSPRVQ